MKKLYKQTESIGFYYDRCKEKEESSKQTVIRYLDRPSNETKTIVDEDAIFKLLDEFCPFGFEGKSLFSHKRYFNWHIKMYPNLIKNFIYSIKYEELNETEITFDELKAGLNVKEFKEYLKDNSLNKGKERLLLLKNSQSILTNEDYVDEDVGKRTINFLGMYSSYKEIQKRISEDIKNVKVIEKEIHSKDIWDMMRHIYQTVRTEDEIIKYIVLKINEDEDYDILVDGMVFGGKP
ncbi:MAG: hypothetical protein ACLTT4_00815 [Coprobacillus cateniformis]|jgi:hypothetical protein